MAFHLICVNAFGKYTKGERVEDQDEVATLSNDRDHHFVRVAAPEEPDAPAPAPAEAE